RAMSLPSKAGLLVMESRTCVCARRSMKRAIVSAARRSVSKADETPGGGFRSGFQPPRGAGFGRDEMSRTGLGLLLCAMVFAGPVAAQTSAPAKADATKAAHPDLSGF